MPAHSPDPELIRTLAGLNAVPAQTAAFRARRAVQGSLTTRQQQQARSRHGRALAIAGICAAILLASPIAWNAVDDILDGVPWTELHPQMTTLLLVIFSAILSALLILFRSTRAFHLGKRN